MDREDYQKVKQIFQSALDISPGERARYLNDKCSGNPRFRREVEKLLDSYKSNYLEKPAVGKFAETIVSSYLAVGQLVGHYKIREKIGAGGMGEVYLAEDSKLDRQVAIKILPREFTEDAERIRRFIREAKFVSALNHPNIVTIHEIGHSDGQQFIAAEYIEGETLREHLKRERLSLASALEISIQIASALKAAHGAGIIHRDIKPDNIMIRPDGLTKVLDFGIAKLAEPSAGAFDVDAEAATATEGTTPGMLVGTANYMSPEQARGDEIDERTDIFNFGIVLYEMVSGKRAFEGANTMDVIGAILHKEPIPLNQVMPELPEAVERIVNKALRKDRAERFQTAKDLLTELKTAKQDLDFRDKRHSSDFANKASSAEFISTEVKKHKRGFAAALLVLLAVAIGFGYWFFLSRAANTKQIESIAVMPFVNDSGNADAEYLSDGMTETLISSLSRLSTLNVKARSTVFRYKGKATDSQTVGKELNVQAILNGRMVQRGEQLTLTLELVDAQTENIIWSEQYNRKQTDLVSLVTEIARDVSQKLKNKLSSAEEQKIVKKSTENTEAYRLYLQGRFYWNKRTAENIRKAMEQFKAAADKDPNYALAYAGLADCYVLMPELMGTPTSEALPQAKAYANRAIELDDSLPEPHTALGLIHSYLWNWAEAEKEYKRAIELNPYYPTAHHWYSRLLRIMGRSDEGLAEIKRANELDPLSLVILANVSQAYMERGEMDKAIEQAGKILELDPNYAGGHFVLAHVYLKQGRTAEALLEAQKTAELDNSSQIALSRIGSADAISGNRKEALGIIKELEEKYAKREADPFLLAIIYAGLGENEAAFAWLERAFQDRSSEAAELKISFELEPLRGDPRFKDLLRRMNLPE
jgi:eukaryotic-like serine/threonine-protein kinase